MTESLFLRIHLGLFIVPGDVKTDRHSRPLDVNGSQRTRVLFAPGFLGEGKDPYSACVSLQGVSRLEHRTNIETVSEQCGSNKSLSCSQLDLAIHAVLEFSNARKRERLIPVPRCKASPQGGWSTRAISLCGR